MNNFEDYLLALLGKMAEWKASDLYLTTGAAPSVRVQGVYHRLGERKLQAGQTRGLAYQMISADQIATFEREKELNFAYWAKEVGRFRISLYQQRGEVAIVARFITAEVPRLNQLGLPKSIEAFSLLQRGLVLVVGATGSGKSTTLAAMVDHRARIKTGHILMLEDPIEYLMTHCKSTIDQREIGVDTLSYAHGLHSAMRQAPDMIVLGEIRDAETMRLALAYAETGHVCLATLHANNANQAVKRVVNFFPDSAHPQVLQDLALNLAGVVSQRLLPGLNDRQVLATEVMTQSGLVSDLIAKGAINELKAAMGRGDAAGMQTFDQCLMQLVQQNLLSADVALDNADSRTDFGLKLRLAKGAATPGTEPASPRLS